MSEHLARAVIAARAERRWSRERLAAEAGFSLATLVRVEGGRQPSVSHLLALADALEMSLDDLVGRHAAGERDARTAGQRRGAARKQRSMPFATE
jgi:transcriptional regulator with XRE-family HTH domain